MASNTLTKSKRKRVTPITRRKRTSKAGAKRAPALSPRDPMAMIAVEFQLNDNITGDLCRQQDAAQLAGDKKAYRDLERRKDQQHRIYRSIMERAAKGGATTLAGISAQLFLIEHIEESGHTGYAHRIAASARRSLASLAGPPLLAPNLLALTSEQVAAKVVAMVGGGLSPHDYTALTRQVAEVLGGVSVP